MKTYVGIDLHARTSQLCVIDAEKGERILERARVPNRLPEILELLEWSYPAFTDRLVLSAIGLKRYLLSKFTGDIRSMPEWRLSGLYQASIH